jgi:hypothetical protein
MTQRKGRRTPVQNEREYPHIVEMAVPPNGLGTKLDAMYDFHRERGIEARRGRGSRRDVQDFVWCCFANRSDADAFQKAFGGNSA